VVAQVAGVAGITLVANARGLTVRIVAAPVAAAVQTGGGAGGQTGAIRVVVLVSVAAVFAAIPGIARVAAADRLAPLLFTDTVA
jgi:hypothetical protein